MEHATNALQNIMTEWTPHSIKHNAIKNPGGCDMHPVSNQGDHVGVPESECPAREGRVLRPLRPPGRDVDRTGGGAVFS